MAMKDIGAIATKSPEAIKSTYVASAPPRKQKITGKVPRKRKSMFSLVFPCHDSCFMLIVVTLVWPGR